MYKVRDWVAGSFLLALALGVFAVQIYSVSPIKYFTNYTDDIQGATDTAITEIRVDTVVSEWKDISDIDRFQFWVELRGLSDTNFATDTFFFRFQTSFDRQTIASLWEVDTLLAVGSGVSVLNISSDDSIIGKYGRLHFVHWDSNEITMPGLDSNEYKYLPRLFLLEK